jgi:phospholipid/cholesterol/gamma-HCH transport system ATP-binding protein
VDTQKANTQSMHEQATKSEPRLIVQGLKAGYGGTIILHDVSFAVEPGEVRVILGTSGCGKSTLMNNILGLFKPLSGKICYLGQWLDSSVQVPNEQLLMRSGVLFQNGALLSSYTVAENIALPLRMHLPYLSEDIISEMVAAKLEMVNLLHAYYKQPSELSGGMRKRAALARAIINDPELLFCDEPSAGLDPVTSRELDDLLLYLRDEMGLSILIVTHELDSIKTIGSKLLFLEKGRVLLDDSLDNGLKSDIPEISNFFARLGNEDRLGAQKPNLHFVD